MTKEENYTYLLIRSILTKCGFSGKLPKTMVTVRWVQSLKKKLEASYTGCMIDAYGRTDNKWHATILSGESLNHAIKLMLIYEITNHACAIMRDPTNLPPAHHITCAVDSRWVINSFLPNRFIKY